MSRGPYLTRVPSLHGRFHSFNNDGLRLSFQIKVRLDLFWSGREIPHRVARVTQPLISCVHVKTQASLQLVPLQKLKNDGQLGPH